MRDTPNEILKKQREILISKTPQERFKIGLDLIDFGRDTIRQSILFENPDISERELKRRVFKRCYANDFPELEMEKILKLL